MNRFCKSFSAAFLTIPMIFVLSACGQKQDDTPASLWDNALYQEDTAFGDGKTTVEVEVKAEEKSVTFTLHTDEKMLGDALLSENLITGEEGDYGMYIQSVNGMVADYEADKSYWAFYQNGEYMNVGVDAAEIADGDHYELVREQ